MCYEPLLCPNRDCEQPVPRCSRQYGIRREYKCPYCGITFRTVETVEVVVERQAFQMWLKGFMKGEKTNGQAKEGG